MKTKYVPNQLFAEPSLVEGLASVLDVGGLLHKDYNTSESEQEADRKALQNDWRAVGDDIRVSISKYECESSATAK